MSKAPEWIYLDGDVEAGDGMFPRCFENPKYASEPQVEYVRVDLAEAAEQQGYASAMEDARKLHEARIEELEAKLAKAVEALTKAAEYHEDERTWWDIDRSKDIRAILAELGEGEKGEKGGHDD
jgi:TPP-dependent trihydroxycyclohexane-1,2-dione (THcHDO) dehydratase